MDDGVHYNSHHIFQTAGHVGSFVGAGSASGDITNFSDTSSELLKNNENTTTEDIISSSFHMGDAVDGRPECEEVIGNVDPTTKTHLATSHNLEKQQDSAELLNNRYKSSF